MITFKTTCEYIKKDFKRKLLMEGKSPSLLSYLYILSLRSFIGILFYRLSRFFFFTRFKILSFILFQLNIILFKIEISAQADIGPGLVFGKGGGIGMTNIVTIGKNCTIHAGFVATLAFDGIDDGSHKVVIGDYCVIGFKSRIMRPVVLADGTQVLDHATVLRSTEKPGTIVSGFPARRKGVVDINEIMGWNSLYGGPLMEECK